MQQEAAASSKIGIAAIDLKDAQSEIVRQEALILSLREEIAQMRTSAADFSAETKGEQQQIGASLNKTRQQLIEQGTRLDLAEKRLAAVRSFLSSKNSRLTQIAMNLEAALVNLPQAQHRLVQSDESISIQFDEGFFFIKDGYKLSDFGNALILDLVGSFTGQKDLLVEVVAYPTISPGSIESWQSASKRANVIAYELVSRYGLSPKQVSAAGKQGETIIIDGAPAESKQRRTVELSVRLNPLNYPPLRIVN